MAGDQGKDHGKGGLSGSGVKDARQDRLKLALRENLKRRKSQARGRDEAASSELPASILNEADDNGPQR